VSPGCCIFSFASASPFAIVSPGSTCVYFFPSLSRCSWVKLLVYARHYNSMRATLCEHSLFSD